MPLLVGVACPAIVVLAALPVPTFRDLEGLLPDHDQASPLAGQGEPSGAGGSEPAPEGLR
jgi:hypothetical protein